MPRSLLHHPILSSFSATKTFKMVFIPLFILLLAFGSFSTNALMMDKLLIAAKGLAPAMVTEIAPFGNSSSNTTATITWAKTSCPSVSLMSQWSSTRIFRTNATWKRFP
ncbi:hypothetical protein RvY_05558-2 [Ramazzottius varieornatus]|uniref:Uncharacterized protein n=1 Tax=Ramazzottius varieornatus TaxID=947166 RepID=A0A1D1V4G5_RAMVA|nr:hypothetical protein RvY_05558-2 [Ramazzottius varieornatus]